jgi:hypothetical protein
MPCRCTFLSQGAAPGLPHDIDGADVLIYGAVDL